MPTPPQLSSESNEWYTPPPIVELSRRVLGGIDLDPASCAWSNYHLIRATRWIGMEENGRVVPWGSPDAPVSVFLNPPGGKDGVGRAARSMAAVWWERLMAERARGALRHAIFVGFSLAILRTTQTGSLPSPINFPLCIPRQRQQFVSAVTLRPAKSPTRDNVIIYIPSIEDASATFLTEAEATFGDVSVGRLPRV